MNYLKEIINIKNNLFSNNNYCDRVKEKKGQKKKLKFYICLPLGVFDINKFVLIFIYLPGIRMRMGRIYNKTRSNRLSKSLFGYKILVYTLLLQRIRIHQIFSHVRQIDDKMRIGNYQ